MTLKWNELTERERDAAVAEHCMGWILDGRWWRDANRRIVSYHPDIPSPSTSIADAYEVVEKLSASHTVAIGRGVGGNPNWQVGFYPDDNSEFMGEAKTLPEAISIAALRASGIEVEI